MIRRLALILGFFFVATAALAQTYTAQGMSDGYLNLRAGPGTNHGIITRLYPGNEVTRLAKRGNWLKVRLSNGEIGWASQSFLVRVVSSNGPLLYVQPTNDGFLNMRSGPGTGYRIKQRLYTGTEVKMIGRSGNWIHVRHSNGRTGWAHSRYLK
ncbi:SH3 domain-containing protein [uncultured Sulfitobacter sp.]|uniref:SH3 domain-containing protein n=1 Tax=uncultured Sulfitobacter sp. TaxID=191468 RepID=UPI00262CF387|nr:SH3 domain-containing protein [uncultured Sulfitobacter sp.]